MPPAARGRHLRTILPGWGMDSAGSKHNSALDHPSAQPADSILNSLAMPAVVTACRPDSKH